MANARTTRTSRTKKATELIVDEDTKARVTETQDKSGTKKIIQYEATVKENEDDNAEIDENGENQDIFENDYLYSQSHIEAIPKNPIDSMFDELAKIEDNPHTKFFAQVTRVADSFEDDFFIKCSTDSPLGYFQFTFRDRLNFPSHLQRKNNNSGGRFNILVLDNEQQPIEFHAGYVPNPRGLKAIPRIKQIGCVNVAIPNPPIDETKATEQNNGQFSMMEFFAKIDERNAERQKLAEERTEKLLLTLKEKTPVERALEEKMIQSVLNPPQPQTNQLESTFAQMLLMPQMVNKWSERMFPAEVQPHEPTLLEQIKDVASTPIVTGLFEKIGDIAEAIAVSKLNQQMQAQAQQNAAQNPSVASLQGNQLINNEIEENENEMTEQEELITDIIEELESENPLTLENEFIIKLRNAFPKEAAKLIDYCRMFDFQTILKLLLAETQNINPYPFMPFLDTEKTNQENGFVWNEKGEKLTKRLEEFYEVVKTI